MKLFWKNSDEVCNRIVSAPGLLVTLDFDGTLAALAETPGQARLKPEFKTALRALAALSGVSVFILSGRALESVRKLVGLRNLYYGGNHGIEIKGLGFVWRDAGAAKARDLVASIAADMQERFPPGTGILVENKVFSASVHYRNLKAAYRRGFFSRMKALMAAQSKALCWRSGHLVFELLPKGAAHKGSAVDKLSKQLGCTLNVAVGDDLTDEDMFNALAKKGITIRVGRKTLSRAGYFLAGQTEVLRLLRFIVSARRRGIK
ncbi:MAG: trehalose-phosphatase [Elusimicrobia bacterium GWC2_51_8]|nr:MAG: trehalose-phosphatase [Elusimicrobia bacterium GWA2_51_34]OGR63744.1 MAG: trehalose-phosphatase [Elusimicrobia bacterium GWC2_51_8]OGR86275.1 MAG: trehalose-phosphatase [Elusimicrobia bacterium GWF2_52_66]HAF95278.1 trehalose-phosphatase [Elusimicrobiota bacterium]HCE97356.1 trehalose-phosphatase [Elusimicrobiota bacterium]